MTMFKTRLGWSALALAVLLGIGMNGLAFSQHAAQQGGARPGGSSRLSGGAHQHLDGRYSHNQYYYDRGFTVRRPPAGGIGELRGSDGGRYWFHGGHWYRWSGGGWAVWGAPIGLFIPYLPFYFTTVWWGGIPYYYANETYYIWNDGRQEYQVVAPPDGIEAGGTPQMPPSDQLFTYPKNGQTAEQQDKDRYECHQWAVGQSGFDPTKSDGGVAPELAAAKRNDYFRAQVACLESRGYTVK